MQWKSLKKSDPAVTTWMQGEIRQYVKSARWYGGKASRDKLFIADHMLPIDYEGVRYYLLLIEIMYEEGFVHNYMLPLAQSNPDNVENPKGIIAAIPKSKEVLADATYVAHFREAIFYYMRKGQLLDVHMGYLQFEKGRAFTNEDTAITSRLLNAEQSNTTIVYNDVYFCKFYRRLFRDPNPDIEMVQHLSEKCGFGHVPAFASSITWKRKGIYDVSIAMMQLKVENEGDAWTWTNARLAESFQNIIAKRTKGDSIPALKLFKTRSFEGTPQIVREAIGNDLLHGVKMMAIRTAEMHIHLGHEPYNRLFTRSSYNGDYAVWLKNRINYQFEARYALLDKSLPKLKGLAKEYGRFFYENKTELKNRIYSFDEHDLTGQRTRIHGDYHLGQLLVSKGDFVILDFEGEPESTIHDRKVKQSPLKDVSGIFRSFHYAIYATIFNNKKITVKQQTELFEIGERIYSWMVAIFLNHYLKKAFDSTLNIGYDHEIEYLLKYHLLEKAIYELGYELNARPDWAIIPLRGIYTILQSSKK